MRERGEAPTPYIPALRFVWLAPAYDVRAGFKAVEETRTFATVWGTLSLYRGVKPH